MGECVGAGWRPGGGCADGAFSVEALGLRRAEPPGLEHIRGAKPLKLADQCLQFPSQDSQSVYHR